jgi:nucleoside-diphosphate-sugar epimerase
MAGELVLLTGGTGYIGSSILVDLLKSGYRVRVAARSQAKIDRVLAAPSISAMDAPATNLTFVTVPDMTAPGAYDEAVDGVDYIVHAAAPLHSGETGSAAATDQLQDVFVRASVEGNLGILRSARDKGAKVKRIVMTSSTVAIAPAALYVQGVDEQNVVRGPDTRITAPAPPYTSELEAYCAGKVAALNAAEAFVRDNSLSFDMISIMPSLVFGRDELVTKAGGARTYSTHMLINGLLTGVWDEKAVGNAVLCSDVARAHVKALDPSVQGGQSFVLNVGAHWEDTVPIAKKYFPEEFKAGLFKEGNPKLTISLDWDSSKVSSLDTSIGPPGLGMDSCLHGFRARREMSWVSNFPNTTRWSKRWLEST